MLLRSWSSARPWPIKTGLTRTHWESMSSWDAPNLPSPFERSWELWVRYSRFRWIMTPLQLHTCRLRNSQKRFRHCGANLWRPADLAGPVNAQLRAVDADQPAYDIRTLEKVVADGLSGIESSARMMMSLRCLCAHPGRGGDLRGHGVLGHPTHP